MNDLLEWLEEGKAIAEQEFLSEGHVPASAIVFSGDDALMLAMNPDGPSDKQAFRQAIEEAVAKKRASAVCFIAEIWYDTFPLHAAGLTEQLHRGEGLLVCAEDAAGRTACALSHIDRDSDEVLGDWKMLGQVEVQGLFTGFFKHRNRKPELLN